MNTEMVHGRLREVKGWALENLGRAMRDPWMRIAGRRERLLGRLEASFTIPAVPRAAQPTRGSRAA